MNRFLLGAGLVAMATSASAADLPATPYTKAPQIVASAYDWTGFYIGGNVGYSFGRAKNDSTSTLNGVPPVLNADRAPVDGVIGGAQLGWNTQFNNLVFGVEADFQGIGQRGSTSTSTGFSTPGGLAFGTDNQTRDERLDWFGTVRARVGLANAGILWFGTGGLAYGHIKFTGADSFPITVLGFGSAIANGSFDASQTKIGWSLGGGVEVAAMAPNWTWKLEYLHLDFGRLKYAFVATGVPVIPIPISGSSRFTDDIFRVGLNYRFNNGVVARY
jgi:outer membrane immunogenic protein